MKKIVIAISVVAVMAVASVCVFCTVKANENPFLNANVEALASGRLCLQSLIREDKNRTIYYCSTCTIVHYEYSSLAFCH